MGLRALCVYGSIVSSFSSARQSTIKLALSAEFGRILFTSKMFLPILVQFYYCYISMFFQECLSLTLEMKLQLRTNWFTSPWALRLFSVTVYFIPEWLQRQNVIKKSRCKINFIYIFDYMRELVDEANEVNRFKLFCE